MKRALRIIVPVVLVIIAVPVGLLVSAFTGMAPLQAGRALGPGTVTLKDSFVGLFMLDAGGGRVALVDAGMDESAETILAELKRRGLPRDAVTDIFLTHSHGDHTGAAVAFPSARVHALAEEAALLDGQAHGRSPMAAVAGAPTRRLPAVPHKDGDVVEAGDLRVEVFALPGHTAGSAAYLAGGVLFLGDSADRAADGSLHRAKWLFSDDVEQNARALRALAARLGPRAAEVKFMAPAHSDAFTGVDALVAWAATP